jgi:tRNA-2-methylthio-N6-dimethylallyladenosine synthase
MDTQKLIRDIPVLTLSKNEVKIESNPAAGNDGKKLYIESYGCQMNFSDSEIVTSVMQQAGFSRTSTPESADVIFINTCSIREKAEQTVRNRLAHFNSLKKNKPGIMIGVLGCMAERLKKNLLDEEKMVDLVVGPDAYRDLPGLVQQADEGHKAVNTFLSREETYADISPVRLDSNGVTAFISIMRGCDNMCSFCVVPFTRGRERSRDPHSIVREAEELYKSGYREVTLLGQNVDSYKWSDAENSSNAPRTINFAGLLEMVALVHPDLRVRFSTSHPKDMTDEVLHTMKRHDNICKYIHLPAQSGSSRILESMSRSYTREWYLQRIAAIRDILGDDCGISSDLIAGFCGETEDAHKETLSLMDEVVYDFAYMFMYSERPGTPAARRLTDDVPAEVKKRRLQEIIDLQRTHSLTRNQRDIGKTFRVLIEGPSKRSDAFLQGRNSANKVVVFPRGSARAGDYVHVHVHDCTGATLLGEIKDSTFPDQQVIF